jgi:hypothetical protein
MEAAEREMLEQAERAAAEWAGIPFCEEHRREHTWSPSGYMCESCGWEAQAMIEGGRNGSI